MGTPTVIPVGPHPTDQEVEDQQTAEKDAAREEHNKRTGGGAYPLGRPERYES